MRALVVTGPRQASVQEVDAPVPAPGELLIDVERVGICGTDVELYTGEMAYFGQGVTHFPLRLGHEWTGRVVGVGTSQDEAWIGQRITGDTMLGCGRCSYCMSGHHHVCENRFEVGIRDGWAGALAEQMLIPTRFAYPIPEQVSVTSAALVEPGGNSLRAVRAAAIAPGHHVLVLGSGTIGLLAAQFALAEGAIVHVAGVRAGSLALATSLGVQHTWQIADLAASPDSQFDSVIEATSVETSPALAVRLVKPAGRVVFIGLSSTPSLVDTRDIALKDVTAVGILSASPGLAGAIESFASGAVAPDAIVSEVIGLDGVPSRLDGLRGEQRWSGPQGARGSEALTMTTLPDAPDDQTTNDRVVGSDRVLAVLLELAEHPAGITLDELATTMHGSKPTIHRALASLRRAGLADQLGRGLYVLGDEYIRLAFRNHDARPETARIEPLLRRLSTEYGETAHYAVLNGHDVVYRAKVDPPQGAVRLTSTIGGRNPVYRTAVGKLLLSFQVSTEAELDDWLDGVVLEAKTPNTITSSTALLKELRTIRARGYATDDQENEVGVNCIALPVHLTGSALPSGAVSVSGLVFRRPLVSLVAALPALRQTIVDELGPNSTGIPQL